MQSDMENQTNFLETVAKNPYLVGMPKIKLFAESTTHRQEI